MMDVIVEDELDTNKSFSSEEEDETKIKPDDEYSTGDKDGFQEEDVRHAVT